VVNRVDSFFLPNMLEMPIKYVTSSLEPTMYGLSLSLNAVISREKFSFYYLLRNLLFRINC